MTTTKGMVESANNTEYVYVAAGDINGLLRGKRIPFNQMEKAENGAIRLP